MPALNSLLEGWGMALSGEVLEGDFELAEHKVSYASGTSIARWPSEGVVIAKDLNDQGKGTRELYSTAFLFVSGITIIVQCHVLNFLKNTLPILCSTMGRFLRWTCMAACTCIGNHIH